MKSIFLRIYGGMLLALLLVSGLGLLGLHWINEVRGEHYREELARGTFRLMADNLQPMTATERKRALAQWSRLLGIPLQLRGLDELRMDGRSRARLMNGQVLVKQTAEHAVTVYTGQRRREPGAQRRGAAGQRATGAGHGLPADGRTGALPGQRTALPPGADRPRQALRLPGASAPGQELDLDDDQRRRVVEGDTVMALGKDGDSIRIFAGILDTPWVLELGPLFQMNLYPPQLLLLLGALCLSFIGLITYLLVRRLEQRLRSLEAAATRIARGSLDTRVEVRGGDSVGRLGAAFNHMAEHIHRLLTVQREMVRAVSRAAHAGGAVALRPGDDRDRRDRRRPPEVPGGHGQRYPGPRQAGRRDAHLRAPGTGLAAADLPAPGAGRAGAPGGGGDRPLRREVLVSCEEGALVPEELGSWIEAEPRYRIGPCRTC